MTRVIGACPMVLPAGLPAALVIAVLAATPAVAHAQDSSKTVALAPLETMGAESKTSVKTATLVARALAGVPEHNLVSGKDVRQALTKNPRLRTCAGRASCLAELGKAVGAGYVVFGEVGGLGAAEVVYLELIDVAQGKSIRSTTLELADSGAVGSGAGSTDTNIDNAARAAVFQLLAPERYVGSLHANVDVEGASIYVDGQRLAKSPAPDLELTVGSHAIRVTHPEFRDYVRFVDIEFNKTTTVDASLHEFPIVATDLAHNPADPSRPRSDVLYRGQEPTPWYRQWYTVAGAGAATLIGSAIIVGLLANGIDADDEKIIENPLP